MNKILDLTGEICPMNFVKAKLFLEDIAKGEIAVIILDEGDPLLNVTRSLKEEGYRVIRVEPNDTRAYKIFVEKGE